MNPFMTWVVAHTTLRERTRVCGRCGNAQLAAASDATKTIACRRCGAPLAAQPAAQPSRVHER